MRITPSQTIGPFFAYSLTAEQYGYDFNSIVNGNLNADLNTLHVGSPSPSGRAGVGLPSPSEKVGVGLIFVCGRVLDGAGNTINDALIELWQADSNGQYRLTPIHHKNDGFTGFGRLGTGTNAEHRFTFTTLKPAAIEAGQAPHINVILFMRGSLRQLYTRIYFSDEVLENQQDTLLQSVSEERRHTLIAQRNDINGQIFYTFDIKMQGEGETVFFDLY